MFNFMFMGNDYEQRKVENSVLENGAEIDTCSVSDSAQPYETAVKHTHYNGGKWVIVELYDSKQEAQEGHNRWVVTMSANPLPKTLRDVSSAGIAQFVDVFGGDDWRDYSAEDDE